MNYMNTFHEHVYSSPERQKPDWEVPAHELIAHVDLRPEGKRMFHAIFVDPYDQQEVLRRIEAAKRDMGCEREILVVTPTTTEQIADIALPNEHLTTSFPYPQKLEDYLERESSEDRSSEVRQWAEEHPHAIRSLFFERSKGPIRKHFCRTQS